MRIDACDGMAVEFDEASGRYSFVAAGGSRVWFSQDQTSWLIPLLQEIEAGDYAPKSDPEITPRSSGPTP